MKCDDYRVLYSVYTHYPVPDEVWDSPEGIEWADHGIACVPCSDWTQGREVEARGARLEDYPCVHTAYYATFECDEHDELDACSDAPIVYNERYDEYALGARGGTGGEYVISYCPWCGVALPPSQREAWFAALEAKGIDPTADEVPAAFQTRAWRET